MSMVHIRSCCNDQALYPQGTGRCWELEGPGTTSLNARRGCQDVAQLAFSWPEHWVMRGESSASGA